MIRPATQSDLDYIQANAVEDLKDYPPLKISGDVVAVSNNGELWGVGGVVILRPGVGEFWAMLTENFKEHVSSREAVTEISDQVNALGVKHDLVRSQAIVRVDSPVAIRMIEWLGFEREGRLRKYILNKLDAYMYSIIKEA